MVMRIGGLATGIDTDSMVKQLMQAHRMPLNKLTQKKQTFEWQREAYRELNSKLTTFRNNAIFNMKLESTLAPKKATIVGGSKGIEATASPNAGAGTLVVEVLAIASAASNNSSAAIGKNGFEPGKLLIEQSDLGKLAGGNLEGSKYKFKINGKEVEVDPLTDTMNSVLTKINRETNVSAFYDSVTGKVSFMSKDTGSVNNSADGLNITFEDLDGGNFLSDFLQVSDGSAEEMTAKDASVRINGLLTERKSNSFTVNGIQIMMKEAKPGESITINVSGDIDKTVENIKSFIDSYNEMLSYLQDLGSAPKYRDFTPLTAEQKTDMSEKDIERWEEKAKSGVLRNDMIISGAVSAMRSAIMAIVDTGSTKYKTLSSIGIETGSYAENGKLYLGDENKLRKALEEEPNAVMKLFTATDDADETRSRVGIASRIHDDLKGSLDQISTKAGRFLTLSDESILSKQLLRVSDDIKSMDRRLTQLESNYYRKFTAMEQAINRLNSQSSYLANAFGGGQPQ